MEREIHALVLEHERGVFGGHRPQALERPAKSRERDAVLVHPSRGVAALRPVLPGCAEIPAEKPVDFRDRAPADERDRPARSVAYRREQMPEIVVDPHEVRAFGDVQKRPVDVQEESRVRGQARHGSEREPDVRDRPVLERLSSRSRGGHVATPAAGFRHRHP